MALETIEKQVGQLFCIGVGGPDLDNGASELLNEISPGGVCLFARNIREMRQTRDLLDGIRSISATVPFLCVDQEGGTVDRLRRLMTPMPAANKIATPANAARLASIIAETLRTLGFNVDFAPVVDVVDVARSKYSNGLFSRAFGRSAAESAALAGEFLRTLQANGVLGCLKHFPGLGTSEVDSHEELPMVNISDDVLRSTDLFPYREIFAATDVQSVMVAHACFPYSNLQESDQNGKLLPTSLSYNFVTNLLRGELGFGGLVITDDLEMGAIIKNYGIGDACKMAIQAGADMLAICADPQAVREGYDAVLKAIGNGEISKTRLSESLDRIAAAKTRLSEPLIYDAARLEELSAEIKQLG